MSNTIIDPIMSMVIGDGAKELEGKFALITGGSNGIGWECSRMLLKHGVQRLAILDLIVAQDSCRRLVNEFGKDRLLLLKCDVTSQVALETAFKTVMEQFKTLDILVNNAGILNDAEWEKEVNINVNGTIRSTLLGLKHMSQAEGGHGGTIVNVSALAGLAPSAGCPIYTATSHAIVGLTNALAMPFHFSKTGVRMMTICPGITYTKIISGICKKMLSEEMGKEWLKELSMTSTQKPESVANGLFDMLMKGKNGSVWVSDAGQLVFEVTHPSIVEMRRINNA